jgi:hypothetical protein
LWDVATGQELATLEGQGMIYNRVMFSADDRAMAASPYGGRLNLWRAPTWPEIDAAERLDRSVPVSANGNAEELEAAALRDLGAAEEHSRARRARDPGPSNSGLSWRHSFGDACGNGKRAGAG